MNTNENVANVQDEFEAVNNIRYKNGCDFIEADDSRLNLIDLFISKVINNSKVTHLTVEEDGLVDVHFMKEGIAKRYELGRFKGNFTYDEFINNTDIKTTLQAFNIDPEEFWFLLLFIYDYTYYNCQNINNPTQTKEATLLHLCDFARQLTYFFRLPQYKDVCNTNKGVTNRPLLISRLAFLTGLTSDTTYCNSSVALISVVEQYKEKPINEVNLGYSKC